jgi:hypothetical protein
LGSGISEVDEFEGSRLEEIVENGEEEEEEEGRRDQEENEELHVVEEESDGGFQLQNVEDEGLEEFEAKRSKEGQLRRVC